MSSEATEMPMLSARIDERLSALKLSARLASITAVNKPDMIREIRRGRRPSADRLALLADVLQTTPDYLLGRSDSPNLTNGRIAAQDERREFVGRSLVKDLPIYGTALGCDLTFENVGGAVVAVEQTTVDMAGPIDFLRRPAGLVSNRQAYAVIVSGESMHPRFKNGETILVDPRRPPAVGNDVVVQLRGNQGGDADRVVRVLVKMLVRRTAHYLELEQFNPPCAFKVAIADVAALHRVVPWGEAMAF